MCSRISASQLLSGYSLLVANIGLMFFQKAGVNNIGELVFILCSIIFGLIILRGLSKNAVWAWPALIVFLALALANSLYLFVATKNTGVFAATIVMNLFGMVFSVMWSIEEDELPKTNPVVEEPKYDPPYQPYEIIWPTKEDKLVRKKKKLRKKRGKK